jgi:hypothetical protein
MKSSDHTAFTADATASGWRSRGGNLFFVRLGIFSPSAGLFDHLIERIDHERIALCPVNALPVIRRPRELRFSTGPSDR